MSRLSTFSQEWSSDLSEEFSSTGGDDSIATRGTRRGSNTSQRTRAAGARQTLANARDVKDKIRAYQHKTKQHEMEGLNEDVAVMMDSLAEFEQIMKVMQVNHNKFAKSASVSSNSSRRK